jgi:DNA-binding response OmpR family regulator
LDKRVYGVDVSHIVVIRHIRGSGDLLSHLVGEAGWDVVTCTSSHSTYRTVKTSKPALIILDLPACGSEAAWDFLTLLHLDPELRRTPAIVCAPTCDDLLAREEWLDHHQISIVRKPFDLDELHNAIASVLGQEVHA